MRAAGRANGTPELAVVGAGIVGLSCAWRAAQAGLSVSVLDRGEPGGGASGVAAGMLAPVTEADFGEDELLGLNTEGRALWPGFAAELEEVTGLPTGYAESGALVAAADRDDAPELRRLHALHERLGLGSEWLGPRSARELEPGLSPRVGGGILAPGDGHVDPRAVVAALVAALRSAGGELRTGVEVARIEIRDRRAAGLTLAGGETVTAGAVLVAAGAWSGAGQLAAELGAPAVRPLKGQLIELRAPRGAPPPFARIIRTPRCYLVPRADGRIVLGATSEERGFDTSVTAEGAYRLLEAAHEVLPDVGELELVAVRSGLRPATPDNLPVIGPGEVEGVLWATGHGRNGVLLAPLTAARILAELRQARRAYA